MKLWCLRLAAARFRNRAAPVGRGAYAIRHAGVACAARAVGPGVAGPAAAGIGPGSGPAPPTRRGKSGRLESVRQAADLVGQADGHLDVLVNNAGSRLFDDRGQIYRGTSRSPGTLPIASCDWFPRPALLNSARTKPAISGPRPGRARAGGACRARPG